MSTHMVADLGAVSAGPVCAEKVSENLDRVDILQNVKVNGTRREVLDGAQQDDEVSRVQTVACRHEACQVTKRSAATFRHCERKAD